MSLNWLLNPCLNIIFLEGFPKIHPRYAEEFLQKICYNFDIFFEVVK